MLPSFHRRRRGWQEGSMTFDIPDPEAVFEPDLRIRVVDEVPDNTYGISREYWAEAVGKIYKGYLRNDRDAMVEEGPLRGFILPRWGFEVVRPPFVVFSAEGAEE